MADKDNLIEQMLEHLINDDNQKAEELFHEYVVAKSREIYESLIENEMKDDEDEEVEEDLTIEADDEMKADDEMDLDVEDPTDDLTAALGDEGGEEDEGEEDLDDESEEDLFQKLDDISAELEARFQEMKSGGAGDDMGGMGDEEMKDDFDLETVREYVEPVSAGHGAEKKGQAEKADGSAGGLKFSKNDMGGQSLKFGGEDKSSKGTAGGLANNTPQDMKTGNINVPGGKAGKTGFTHKEPGHGAEKKGASEGSTDGTSLFRGRR